MSERKQEGQRQQYECIADKGKAESNKLQRHNQRSSSQLSTLYSPDTGGTCVRRDVKHVAQW
jgi:hypothetical protein